MYSISKIIWQKKHNAEIFSRCKRILLAEDYIIYTLTGNAQIDYSLAARTAAFDIENKCWVEEIFKTFDIDSCFMSVPVPTGSIAGILREQIKADLGIDYDITVVNGCHDQIAAMIGSGVFNTQQAMDGIGTVECMAVILDNKPENMDFYNCGYSVVPYITGDYACYSFSFTGGAVLKWFRDNFAESENDIAIMNGQNIYAELDSKVNPEPTEILILPHFAGAATPYMDRTSKAVFIGISLETSKYDVYKALMEGTSYEMKANFEALKIYSNEINEIRVTGGGASSDTWMQIKVDITGIDVTALSCKEVGAAGTAALAGVAVGIFNNISEAVSLMVKVRTVFLPSVCNMDIYAKCYKRYKNIYTAVKHLNDSDCVK